MYVRTGGLAGVMLVFSWYVCTQRFVPKHSVYGNLPLPEYGNRADFQALFLDEMENEKKFSLEQHDFTKSRFLET